MYLTTQANMGNIDTAVRKQYLSLLEC